MGESYTIRVKVSPDNATEPLKISPAINCPVSCDAVKDKGTPFGMLRSRRSTRKEEDPWPLIRRVIPPNALSR